MRKILLVGAILASVTASSLLAQGPFPKTVPFQGRLVQQVGGNAG